MGYLSYIAQTEQEAATAFLIACSIVDKPILTQKEADRLGHLRIKSSILPSIADNRIVLSVFAVGEKVGSKSLIDGSIHRIHKEDYKTVFTYCCDMCFSNGAPSKKQTDLLHYIGSLLEITAEFFKVCFAYQRAFSAKNDGYLPG